MYSIHLKLIYKYATIFSLCCFCMLHRTGCFPNLEQSADKTKETLDKNSDKAAVSDGFRTRCSSCSELREGTEEYKFYIERTKAEILSKLNMKEVPRPRIAKNSIPSPIFTGELLGDSRPDDFRIRGDGYHGLTKQIIVVNEQGENFCKIGHCVRFRLTKKLLSIGNIESVQLWLYSQKATLRKNIIRIFEEGRGSNGRYRFKSRFLLASRINTVSDGWFVIDLTKFRSWISSGDLRRNTVELILRIGCSNCQISSQADRAPFLVINTDGNRSTRRKRSLDCHSGKEGCCRERIYVNFTTIGWSDWIIQPKGYEANNCRGKCDDRSVPVYGHTSVMRRIGQYVKSCCTPKRFSSVSLLYYDDAGYIFKKDIPNMSVEECGCS